MPIPNPYHRIWRPLKGYDWSQIMWEEDGPAHKLDYLSGLYRCRDVRFHLGYFKRSKGSSTELYILVLQNE